MHPERTTTGAVEGDMLRRALRTFPTGVTVVTTRGPAGDHGLTATSFTSVSLSPPLVLVCVQADSSGTATIAANGAFAVNVLTAEQGALARRFASPDRPRGPRAFAGVGHASAVTGCPVFGSVGAYLDCRLVRAEPAGDHVIFLGEVLALGCEPESVPLLWLGGRCEALAA
jgi:flavin reductase (DIM6/NTAB) family NADH-FMN oxidoreductase RutF